MVTRTRAVGDGWPSELGGLGLLTRPQSAVSGGVFRTTLAAEERERESKRERERARERESESDVERES